MNVNKLKAYMVLKSVGVGELCKAIGMTAPTFWRRCEGNGADFTQAEICSISTVLGMTNDEIVDIFFSK